MRNVASHRASEYLQVLDRAQDFKEAGHGQGPGSRPGSGHWAGRLGAREKEEEVKSESAHMQQPQRGSCDGRAT